MEKNPPNELIHETSPYLLQHAHNPVRWLPWNEATLERAVREDKPLLISIGYAACHWCHVMEHECFEDPGVAEVMNTLFIPVKVDREERPDVDQIYMDALQIMTGSGGWPLNVAALPDGKPFWGATYLPRDRWLQALEQLGRMYRQDPGRIREYASDLSSALSRINLPGAEPGTGLPGTEQVTEWVASWKPRFDPEYGGMQGAPKFMMPVTLQALMHLDAVRADPEIAAHVRLSLRSMAYGGLFDHLGGGFSRYSVDSRWHVPHFEKMLYDNAQLLSLYARAYAHYGDPLYRETVSRTIRFLVRDLRDPMGGFFASLDADSIDSSGQLEEGAYYCWKKTTLQEVLGVDFPLFASAYNINDFGHWENGNYVLIRTEGEADLARRFGLTENAVREKLASCRERLLTIRDKREPPRLDDKVLTSWNGLLLGGLAEAWRYTGLEEAREAALALGAYLAGTVTREDGSVPHSTRGGDGKGHGFLEDYAALAEGYIALYGATGDPAWMERAQDLCSYALAHFGDEENPVLYFTSALDPALIRRSLETADNVIPASNSIMAKNLYLLGGFFGRSEWKNRSRQMLRAVAPSMERYASQYANWMQLALWMGEPFYEVAVCGPEAGTLSAGLLEKYLPQCLVAPSESESGLPLFKGRFDPGQTRIYICREGSCRRPLEDAAEALKELRSWAE
ncbi:thioredoxin domain-containing protein [Robiginitalea sp. SC105]|uniref:thioredoxin domain-containing protein n=1 Tax=Robiginitalea sp. SC105 TaxID=2762332 RepID=UPI00163A5B64|nr:thioredoxin domain-containing protein [Robiginitalea sp. SC105]MBC2838804.1 thioredoxin domain-containing protein [Robiginitalea sp. SC105]